MGHANGQAVFVLRVNDSRARMLGAARVETVSACQSLNPEIWFEGPDYDPDLAIAACCSCPLMTACLNLALRAETMCSQNRFGIFGGLTPAQRQLMAEAHQRTRQSVAA